MARYVMANRRAGKFLDAEKRASRDAIESGFERLFARGVDLIGDLAPADELARRVLVFDADPIEVSAKAGTLSRDVIVEPEILHFPIAKTRRRAAARTSQRSRPRRRAGVAGRRSDDAVRRSGDVGRYCPVNP
ncbi:MAG TPA: hypothetical protein VFO19_20290, partial [Vicinamibacterales bacterium]|nr:hypothetical protein [Vicinamibacterales bacterium]